MMIISEKIKNLMDELRKNNQETYYHCLNVKKLVNKIVILLNESGVTSYTQEEIDSICKGAFLHDIGKLNIRNYVLTKEERLDKNEVEEIHEHPEKGYDLIKYELGDNEYEIIKNILLYHHERIDGKGYHKMTDIPLYVQIVSICDAYEAMTSDRPYHEALSTKRALDIMEEGGCGSFDSKLFDYLKSVVY